MDTFWRALGLALIKFLVSILAALGAGFLVFALAVSADPGIFQARNPPAALFVAVAVGFLTAATLLAILFLAPWWRRKSPPNHGSFDDREDLGEIPADLGVPDALHKERFSRFKPPPA
jgi:membrane protein implicated in regulation of membrane protease activity